MNAKYIVALLVALQVSLSLCTPDAEGRVLPEDVQMYRRLKAQLRQSFDNFPANLPDPSARSSGILGHITGHIKQPENTATIQMVKGMIKNAVTEEEVDRALFQLLRQYRNAPPFMQRVLDDMIVTRIKEML